MTEKTIEELIAEARTVEALVAEAEVVKREFAPSYLSGIVGRLADALAALITPQERKAHDHSDEPKLWCETHQHTHVASIPRFTYQCKDCGWGQWYRDQAREHESATAVSFHHRHETYEVEHVLRPLAQEGDARERLIEILACGSWAQHNPGSPDTPWNGDPAGLTDQQRVAAMSLGESYRGRSEPFADAILAAFPALSRAATSEPEGRRWYAACWRDDNGTLNSLESETILREYAEAAVKRWRGAEEGEPNGQPDRVVLATKIIHPWESVGGDDE